MGGTFWTFAGRFKPHSKSWYLYAILISSVLDILWSGSSSQPQNPRQPSEEEQEEVRDTLDSGDGLWRGTDQILHPGQLLLSSIYLQVTPYSEVFGVKYLRGHLTWCYWLQTEIRFLKADCCSNWIDKHTEESKHVSSESELWTSECDIQCWWTSS